MNQLLRVISLCIPLSGALGASSDFNEDSTKTYRTDDVVVTATRVNRTPFDIGRNITVMNMKELQISSSNDIGDLLSKGGLGFVAGATLNPGMQQSLFLRGANSNQTAVMFNDIRLTDPSGINNAPNLIEISLADADRIEIVRGPHSTIYGSSAIGGVVNVISQTNQLPGFHVTADLIFGTFGARTFTQTQNVLLNYSMPSGIYANAAVSNSVVQGFDATIDTITNPAIFKNRDRDGFKNLNLIGKIGFKNRDWDVHISHLRVNQKSDIDDGAFRDDDNARFEFERELWTIGALYNINNEFRLKYIGGYSPIKRRAIDDSSIVDQQGTTDHTFTEDTYKGTTSNHELLFSADMTTVHLVLGLGTHRESMTQQSYLFQESAFGIYESRTDLDTLGLNSTINHFFIHTDINSATASEALKNFSLALGARFNQHSSFGNYMTFEINPSYRITNNSMVFISYSTGFNAPSLYQLFCPTTYYTSTVTRGNKSLKPETSASIELGWKFRAEDWIEASISYFRTDVENTIEYIYLWDKNIGVGTLGNDWMRDDYRGDTYLNLGTQKTSGWDIMFNAHLTNSLSLTGSVSMLTGKLLYKPDNNQSQHIEGHHVQLFSNGAFLTQQVETSALVRRPNIYNTGIQYKPRFDLQVRLNVRYVGHRYDAYYNSTVMPWGALDVLKLDDYTLIDVAFRYDINKYLSMNLRLDNILDTQYSEILGYKTKGRSVYLGTRVSF